MKFKRMKLVNSAKIIMDVDFIYVYKSKTYFWKSLVEMYFLAPIHEPPLFERINISILLTPKVNLYMGLLNVRNVQNIIVITNPRNVHVFFV